MQFAGQSHILNVPIAEDGIEIERMQQAFADAYWKRFHVSLPEIRPVIVNLHTAVIGKREPISVRHLAGDDHAATVAEACIARRNVWYADGWVEAPVYERHRLPLGCEFSGPAILEQLDATTIVEPGDHARVDQLGNVIITVSPRGSA